MFALGIDTNLTVTTKLILAALLGIIIGFDREKSGKPAGIRTQMLVCLGSALLSAISVDMISVIDVSDPVSSLYRLDPARLMAQIISGIGFLGAGVILKNGNKIQGVTTAATIWITAAVGIAVGAGFFLPAGVATFLVLLLNPLARLQYKYGLKGDFYLLSVKIKNQKVLEKMFDEKSVDVRERSVVNGQIVFLIHSSKQKNLLVIKYLEKKNIPFELKISID